MYAGKFGGFSIAATRKYCDFAINLLYAKRPNLPSLNIMKNSCVYPGTFDPITNGHLDLIDRAARIFDRVCVAIARNQEKNPLFTAEERLALVKENLKTRPKVEVVLFDGLLVKLAREQNAKAILRGIRAVSDFEYEFQMALMNRHLDKGMETLFLMPDESYIYTSSRLIKQVNHYHGDICKFVPENVAKALAEKLKER